MLVGEVRGSEAFERHPERDVLDDPPAEIEVERLLLQRAVQRRLGGQATGDLDAALERPLVRNHFADDSSLQGGLRVEPLTGPEQPLGVRCPHDLFPQAPLGSLRGSGR